MAENNPMQALREVLQPLPSGPRLAAALESASLANSDIPALISAVLAEKQAAAGVGGKPAAAAGKPAGAAAGGKPAPAVAAAPPPAAPGERVSFDGALSVIDNLQFLNPRGKQQLGLFADRLVVKTAKADIAVPWAAIKHVAIIDRVPGDTKGRVLLYLHVDSERTQVFNGKTLVTAVVIQTTADATLDVAHPQGGGRLQGAAPVVLCQALGAVPGGVNPTCFVSPDAAVFQSADKAAGVQAHVKAKEGFLYPLPSALCFLESPALFLPHSQIRSVELMRAGGASATFDVVLHLRSGKAHEFSFVARQEAASLEDYIRKCRLAVGAAESSEEEEEEGQAGGARGAQAEAEADDEDSSDPEDEDFNPTSSSDEEEEHEEAQAGAGSGGKRAGGSKRKRGAAAEAAADASAGSAPGGSDGEEEEAGSSSDDEDASSGSSESSDESGDEGSVELVSEDGFSLEDLESNVVAQEGSGGRRPKRQRA